MQPQQKAPTSQIVIYIILALLLAFLIAYFIWKILKGKILKKKELKIQKEKEQKSRMLFYDYIITFNEIINFTLKELQNFVPSIGKVKMTEIKDGANKLVTKLLKRDDFAQNFVEKEEYKEFLEHCELLATVNCNIWETKIPNSLSFFKTQYEQIPTTEHTKTYLELVQKSIKEQYYEK
ncbi:MHJ_0274 family protein [Metamycoplasma hyosynoviae]|uniref:Transmembrane protein n=1 Tax=Metamycoplasma hyosynoviae TaxID=29559 RepID=A0A063YIQ1_9BACT|nr:hypothetical protein [Metamycoplasma hyosynoviae]ASI54151.1 hypothetical protein MHSN_03165 [Metamycoplasma hyosynoviae]KDE42167.1 membrane protein [Metamycoplasma hyosynoviae]KDE42226.1 membrane protein [Metamycoplasma hyosynoviae]KDE43887.1 membrane protein [Metamycoplasma hyosynoviae]KDE44533.1 membrane protein [Metamycoplasma hyosynoviae]